MIYKDYGKTGCNVSAVGFGGMRFDMDKSLEENATLLEYAYEKGITYFDTAPGYCDGQSEVIYGTGLKNLPREKIFISTKCMPANSNTYEKTEEAVKGSLAKLKCDYIDFYHVWCLRKMSHYHEAMEPGAQYESLLKLQEQGYVKNIVFSSHQPGPEIKQIVDDGKFSGVLLGANILNFPYRWQGVEAAYNSGMGVVAMNPLAGGAIPKNEKMLSYLASEGLSPTESALRFLICCPQITVTLNGFTTREHIDTACRIADTCKAFTPEEIDNVREHLKENMNSICTGCGYCTQCPEMINIPGFMQVYNDKQMFDKNDEQMKGQMGFEYNWGRLVGRMGEHEKCIECGACEEACTQHLPIMERLKEFANWIPEEK